MFAPLLFFVFLAIGLLYILPGEIFNNVIMNPALGWTNLAKTLLYYTFLLLLSYGLGRSLRNKKRGTQLLLGAVIFGSGGILIEWFLIGNAPWINPGAVQPSMFAWWAGLFLVPRLFLEGSHSRIKKWAFIVWVGHWAPLFCLSFFIAGNAGKWLAVLWFSYQMLLFLPIEVWYVWVSYRAQTSG